MARRVFLHVGTPKSGTTYLQSLMWRNRRLLADEGLLFAGDRFPDRFWATLDIRELPLPEHLPPAAKNAWPRMVQRVAEFEGDVVISHEFFGAATLEQAARAVDDLRPAEVHVVVTARAFVRSVPAMWQESLKFGVPHTLEDFGTQWVAGLPLGSWGRHTGDPADVLQRWCAGLPASSGHVIVVSPRPDHPDELWRRFASLCRVDAGLVDTTSNRPNTSVSVESAELLRRVNEHLGAPIVGPRETPVWIRDELTHRVLSSLPGHGIGLSEPLAGRLAELSVASVASIRAHGWRVIGDLDVLTAPPSARLVGPGDLLSAVLAEQATQAIALMLVRQRERGIELRRLEREIQHGETRLTLQQGQERRVQATLRRSVTSLNRERLSRVGPMAGVVARRVRRRLAGDPDDRD